MPVPFPYLLLTVLVVLVILPQVHAFGAGDIPDYSFLNDKAFRYVSSLFHRVFMRSEPLTSCRHGDIENVLTELNKSIVSQPSGGAMGLFLGVANAFGSGPKFTKMDVKRVYFVRTALNWRSN